MCQKIDDICRQLARYGGGGVFDEKILDILDMITTINDNLWHGRDISEIVANVMLKMQDLGASYAKKRLNTEEAAKYLESKGVKRTTRTLISWRDLGQGPAYYKLGTGAVYYEEEDLDMFVVGNKIEPKLDGK